MRENFVLKNTLEGLWFPTGMDVLSLIGNANYRK